MWKLKIFLISFRFLFFVVEKEGRGKRRRKQKFRRGEFKWWFTTCVGNLIWLMISLRFLKNNKDNSSLYLMWQKQNVGRYKFLQKNVAKKKLQYLLPVFHDSYYFLLLIIIITIFLFYFSYCILFSPERTISFI